MSDEALRLLRSRISDCAFSRPLALVSRIEPRLLRIGRIDADWSLGDRVRIERAESALHGEVVLLDEQGAGVLPEDMPTGVQLGDRVERLGQTALAPHAGWIGRIVDPFGHPLDGRPLAQGGTPVEIRARPPAPAQRKRLGARAETGMRVFNTLLPIVRGQRLGLFAGSGVGKSSLLGALARRLDADITVVALIGERGRELREFAEDVLGPEGMARSIVIAATSDQSPLVRRRCAWAAMATAEYFRDQGQQVLFLADSLTRLAEAHREVALATGEPPSLRGFPPSTSHLLMSLAERSGPGAEGAGDITAVFSILVAGSDMDEPVADILRGVLDGHVVMDRDIAERGRYPAINLLRSVSRSLPAAATDYENKLITKARRLLGAYDRAEMMIQAGLYAAGSDPLTDAAIKVWPALDAFLSETEPGGISESFGRLEQILSTAGPVG